MSDDLQDGDARMMDMALRLAGDAGARGEVPVGAVVVANGRVIGRGSNETIATSDPSAHAEVQALRQAARKLGNYRLPGTTLYVTLEPCAMCAGAMVLARVARLVFACADPRAGAAGSIYEIASDPRLNHRIEVSGGLRGQEAARLLRGFFEGRRRAPGSGQPIPKPDISL